MAFGTLEVGEMGVFHHIKKGCDDDTIASLFVHQLLGDLCGARFAYHRHLDLTGVLHGLFDLLGDVARQPG